MSNQPVSITMKPRTKWLMIGDSITDCGRVRPIGEGKGDPLGSGYVGMIHAWLHASRPDCAIRMVNMGVSGDTVRELKARWKTDVIDLQPDGLSIMIGINDVCRHFNRPFMDELHVGLLEYEQTLEELLTAARLNTKVQDIIVLSPFFVESNSADEIRQLTDRYGEASRRAADRNCAQFIDIQAEFDRLLQALPSMHLAPDRIHPNQIGHMAIARAFLRGAGSL
ncbi:SGNH/GDSL hydrolase family protein [Paenibacillus sp. GCM10023252]|uniref:SGNH/GDSL hydrolase family protein n=1 Tax=Paenibacillus sp. GCM10023252 TaxID=3252649 RepID=UPI00361D18A7